MRDPEYLSSACAAPSDYFSACACLNVQGTTSTVTSTVSESAMSTLFTMTLRAPIASIIATTTAVAAFQLQSAQQATVCVGQITNANANWAVTETIFRAMTDPAAALICIINIGGRL
ncbi:hypothetical protein DL768_010005 [Monosporascus sp. mg162]|nr:hypothetical protein DL768_010005 [Monosporascus sp. mg162]